MTTTFPYRHGWHRDAADPHDIPFVAAESTLQALPAQVSLIPHCPAVYDQLSLGSCTSQVIAAAFEFDLMRQGLKDFTPSRLFIYWYEQFLEGTVNDDAGAAIRDGVKVVNKYGVCPETEWPYDITRFTEQPPLQERLLPEQLCALQTQIATLQQQVADLARLMTPHGPKPALRATPTKHTSTAKREAKSTRSRPAAKTPAKPVHVNPRVEYGEGGHYVVICPKHGMLPIRPDSEAWFAWLREHDSFRGCRESRATSRPIMSGA